MSRFIRLLDEGHDEFELRLLRAALHDEPPDASARRRALAAVQAASAATLAPGAGVSSGKVFVGLSLQATKVIALGSMASSVVLVGVLAMQRYGAPAVATRERPAAGAVIESDARGAALSSSVRAGATRQEGPARPTAVLGSERPMVPRPLPLRSERTRANDDVSAPPQAISAGASGPVAAEAETPGVAAPPDGAADAEAAVPANRESREPRAGVSTLGQETALLRSVREALTESRPGDALARIDAYEARFPRGALHEEAALLRVTALVAAGRSNEARTFVARFEHEQPTSGYCIRMRKLVASSP